MSYLTLVAMVTKLIMVKGEKKNHSDSKKRNYIKTQFRIIHYYQKL